MRVFSIIGIFFYASVIVFAGVLLIASSLNLLQPQAAAELVSYTQDSLNSRLISGLSGALLILISLYFAQLILGKFQREKRIAFTTASGEVSISLSAVEDLIRRLAVSLPEIKELRPDVIATKKGILVDLRLSLRSEANIPEITGRLQDITRSKLQEVLGIEEQIIIKIHVAKIVNREEKERKKRGPQEQQEPAVPFSGYTRV